MSSSARLHRAATRMLYAAAGKSRLREYQALQAHDRLTAAALHVVHRERLRVLLGHAATHVPYYRDRMSELGLDWRTGDPADVLRGLPILTKDVIRRHEHDLVATNFDKAALFRNATGGSTGEPVNFYQDQPYREVSIASRLRAWGWAGFRLGERVAWIWGAPQETGPARTMAGKLVWRLDNRRLYDAFEAGPKEMRAWVEDLRSYRPTFVVGYATALASFARTVLDDGLALPTGIRAVFSTAEQLLPEQRALIERAFSCPVRDQYGSREVQSMAAECSQGRMHIAWDLVHLEFLPPDGDVEAEGFSRILVTPLLAFGMPLIRYDLGDMGLGLDERCPCGLPYPLMKIGVGRTSDVFVTPEGSFVHGEYFTHLLYDVEGIERFQFEQVAPDEVRLRVVPGQAFGQATIDHLERAQAHVHGHVSPRMRIVWETASHIPTTATGKFRFTRSSLGAQALSSGAGKGVGV